MLFKLWKALLVWTLQHQYCCRPFSLKTNYGSKTNKAVREIWNWTNNGLVTESPSHLILKFSLSIIYCCESICSCGMTRPTFCWNSLWSINSNKISSHNVFLTRNQWRGSFRPIYLYSPIFGCSGQRVKNCNYLPPCKTLVI